MEETILRILFLIDASGLTDKQILKELDLSSTSTLISDWRRGKSKSPTLKHVLKIANFFNVSTDYLLTGKEKFKDLSKEEQEWLDLYSQLSSENSTIKNECIGFVKGYIARGKNI